MTTATIQGKVYAVEHTGYERAPYLFHGPRGQTLGAFVDPRNGLLQIVNTRTWQGVPGWYTDANGTLERC